MDFMNTNLVRRVSLAVGAVVIALLTGCASTITAKVTNFNAWPSDGIGSTFSFAPHVVGTVNELEQSTYEEYVAVELEKKGLRRAELNQVGRFLVDVNASGQARTQAFNTPVFRDYPVFVPPRRDREGRIYPGYWAPDPFGPQYLGDRTTYRTITVSQLKVRIFESRALPGGRQGTVFESTGVYEGLYEDLPDLVPYLARALFDGFPGRNGEVRTVTLDPKTGQIIPQR